MNFFRGKDNLLNYYEGNELDEETSFGLDLETAFEVGKKVFNVKKTLSEYEASR